MARRNEHTKDQLKFLALQAANNIIKTESISELSTRKIAKEIGYAAGTLYNIFNNVDDIILHINSQTMLEVMNIFTKKRDSYNQENLIQIINEYVDYIESNYKIWSCLFEYKKVSGEKLPEWYLENMSFIIAAINKCNNEQTVLSELIWNSINGLCYISTTSAAKSLDFSSIKQNCNILVNKLIS